MKLVKLQLDSDAKPAPYTELLTVPEAAARLRLHPETVYRMVAAREIESVRLGRRSLLKASAVEAYIHAHTHQPVTRRGRK